MTGAPKVHTKLQKETTDCPDNDRKYKLLPIWTVIENAQRWEERGLCKCCPLALSLKTFSGLSCHIAAQSGNRYYLEEKRCKKERMGCMYKMSQKLCIAISLPPRQYMSRQQPENKNDWRNSGGTLRQKEKKKNSNSNRVIMVIRVITIDPDDHDNI